MIRIISEHDKITAESMLALLKNNGIEAYIQAPEYGGYSNVLSGQSILGYDIYVDESKVEQAKELLEFLQIPADEEFQKKSEDVEFEEAVLEVKQRKNHFRRVCAIIMILFILVSLFVNYVK